MAQNRFDQVLVLKGNYGEGLVKKYLLENGYLLYVPEEDIAHPFDCLAVKYNYDFMFVEVKTKARMNKYLATGFNLDSYNNYLELTTLYNIPLFVFWVDEHPLEQRIYGNYFHTLALTREIDNTIYPLILGDVILFHLSIMVDVMKLSDKDISILKKYSRRNYDYREQARKPPH